MSWILAKFTSCSTFHLDYSDISFHETKLDGLHQDSVFTMAFKKQRENYMVVSRPTTSLFHDFSRLSRDLQSAVGVRGIWVTELSVVDSFEFCSTYFSLGFLSFKKE